MAFLGFHPLLPRRNHTRSVGTPLRLAPFPPPLASYCSLFARTGLWLLPQFSDATWTPFPSHSHPFTEGKARKRWVLGARRARPPGSARPRHRPRRRPRRSPLAPPGGAALWRRRDRRESAAAPKFPPLAPPRVGSEEPAQRRGAGSGERAPGVCQGRAWLLEKIGKVSMPGFQRIIGYFGLA